jgi:diguanylate cyclase (GGDEF)-like protein
MTTNDDLPGEQPRRILLIENSVRDRAWLCDQLTCESVRLVECRGGQEGFELCRRDPPDLVLLDLGLPLREGFDILRQLKNDGRTAQVPVIVISASTETADIVRGLDDGASDYVTKPYQLVELRARIRVALRAKRFQDMLEQRAHVDGLTGLANRAALEDRLATDWGLHQRHHNSLAVWVADLDFFKRVNDRHGHAAGDEVLRKAASLLRASVRATDLVARYGGEEFVVVAPHCPLDGALKTAERFRERLAASTIGLDRGSVINVTVSIGVASSPEDRVGSAAELLERADRALYVAKSHGRNRVHTHGFPTPVDEPLGWLLATARV